MENLQNLHTHTKYCDGVNTPREMVEAAIKKGFSSIGFSGHSPLSYAEEYCIKPKMLEVYKNEILDLKAEYAGKIEIFCGIEYDMYSKVDISHFEYAIGSAHLLKIGNEYVDFDVDAVGAKRVVDEYFKGDGLAYAKNYYESISHLAEHGKFDIIGHFDIISKHSDNIKLFDEESPEYLDAAFSAIDALTGKIPFFEINSGAIARGYKKTPYPIKPIIKRFLEKGFGAIITTDCHNKDFLDCNFSVSGEILRECGFNSRYILTKDGFKEVAL